MSLKGREIRKALRRELKKELKKELKRQLVFPRHADECQHLKSPSQQNL